MPSSPSIAEKPSGRLALRLRARRGFTLVESMIATAVFTVGILGVYAMMLKSYEMITLSRHRDNARAVLLSFADQFQRLQTNDLPSGQTVPVTRFLFQTTGATAPTGVGLSWTDPAGATVSGTSTGLAMTLGATGTSTVPANVTRIVTDLDSTGTVTTTQVNNAAGRMLMATFTITYTIKGRPQTQSITVARSIR